MRRVGVMAAVAMLAFICRTAAADAEHAHGEAAEITNEICPVMEGNPIDPEIWTVYRGTRVYFCCRTCKAAFEKDPEKYMSRLPQFAAAAPLEEAHEHAGGVDWGEAIEIAGGTTLTLLILTACAGYFMPRKRKVLFRLHKILAVLTILSALCHLTLVAAFH